MEYRWLNELSQEFLEQDYLLPGQTLDNRARVIAKAAATILNRDGWHKCSISNFEEKFLDYLAKGWFSLSTPIWNNFGNRRGLPISCYGSYIEDDMDSIIETQAEVAKMSKLGGGTSGFFGKIRPRGSNITDNGKTSGSVHFMEWFESTIQIISQGSARRGQFAAYLPIDHGDIEEFLAIRSEGSKLQNLSFGVCISDDWFKSMIDGDQDKRRIWAKVLEARKNTGYPYLFFTDTVNRNTVDIYKHFGMKITHSNLCTEICQPDNKHEAFVCDLASPNILYRDEWKDTDMLLVLTYFLDAVMEEFIRKTADLRFMRRAHDFAKRHRALGIGQLGWHSYLQSKMIPFESMEAKLLNVEIARDIKDKVYEASGQLAREYGETTLTKGFGRRNTVLLAIAPTKSSSFILQQVSEGIEPQKSNYYIKDLQKGKFTIKNPYLLKLLKEKDKDSDEIWDSILLNKGSIQHLEFLNQREKDVFKTLREISPMEIIIQAAQRQKYIDQSQSLNILIPNDTPIKDVNKLLITAWELEIKTLYYQYNESCSQELGRSILSCSSCES